MWKDKIKEIIYMLENSDVNEIEVRFWFKKIKVTKKPVSYTHLRAHETP